MFDAIAPRYDLLNRLLSMGLDRRWRRQAVQMLLGEIAPGAGPVRILDVGCGTGDIAIEIARQSRSSHVLGIDHSGAMLTAGMRKVKEAGLAERLVLQAGDAVQTGLPGGSFDGVITAFCFRNIANRQGFLEESARVMKPGRPLLILELTRPRSRVLCALHRNYNARVVPLLGRWLSRGSAYRYLFQSIEVFPDPAEVLAMMTAAGYENVRWTPVTGGVVSVFKGVCRR